MRMDGAAEFQRGCFQRFAEADFGDQVGGAVPDDLAADNLAIFFSGHELYETFDVIDRDRLAVGAEGKLANLDFDTGLLGGGLGHPDSRNFRLTVDASRDVHEIEARLAHPGHNLDRRDSLRRGLMRQQRRAYHVADRKNSLARGAEVIVNFNKSAALDFDADLVQSQTVAVGRAADRHQDHLGLNRLALAAGVQRHAPAVPMARRRLVAMTEQYFDLALEECAAQFFSDLGVESGQHLLFQFDNRHLDAECLVEVSELQSDGAGADYCDAFRNLIVEQGLVAGEHPVADFHAGKQALARSGRDQDAVGLHRGNRRRLAVAARELQAAPAVECGAGFEQLDIVFAEEKTHTERQLVGGLAAARNHTFEIEAYLAGLNSMLLAGAADYFHRFGRVEQRLGRNAAPVKAHAARPVALDDACAHLELACTNRSFVTSGPRTYDCQVVAVIRHAVLLTLPQAPARHPALYQQAGGIFQEAFHLLEKASGHHAVHDSMVARHG